MDFIAFCHLNYFICFELQNDSSLVLLFNNGDNDRYYSLSFFVQLKETETFLTDKELSDIFSLMW